MRTKTTNDNWPDDYTPPFWLPNWREKGSYSRMVTSTTYDFDKDSKTAHKNVNDTKKHEFAWEFLRRNPLYQADYDILVELCEKEGVASRYRTPLGLKIFSSNETPPPSILFHAKLYKALCKWGLNHYLLDPSIPVHETVPLGAILRLGNNSSYPSINFQKVPLRENKSETEKIPTDGGIILDATETFWLFDISLPIKPQLRQAETFLANAQKKRCGKKMQASKTSPKKYVQYLRILDADASGADDKEIMAALFPGKDSFSLTDKHGKLYKNETSHRNPGRDLLKNHRKAAYYLREEGYRFLFM